MSFTLLDLAIVAVFAVAVLDGVRRGFVSYLSEFIAFGAAIALALGLFQPLGQLIHRGLSVGLTLAGFGAFLILLALGHGVVHAPVSRASAWLSDRWKGRRQLSRAFSVLPAAGIAGLVCIMALAVMEALPVDGPRSMVRYSALGSAIVKRTAFVRTPMQQLLNPTAAPTRKLLVNEPTSNPGQDAFYSLHFPANLQTQADPVAEDAMLQKINAARAGAGLSPVRMDDGLRQVARGHSLDMYTRHYFSHQTPDGKTPYDRLQDARVRYLTAGENLAFATDVDQAWESLMNSPDHRANILNPDFRCVGVGAYKGLGGYEEMFTQDFADCAGG